MLYELSWSQTDKQYIFVDQLGSEFYCGQNAPCVGVVGSCTIICNDNSNGKLFVECDTITSCYTTPCPDSYGMLWIQQDIHSVDIPEDAMKLEGSGYWCISFSPSGDWRLIDHNVTWVDNLRGQFGIDWHDMKNHLFHKGDIYKHTDEDEITTGYLIQYPYLSTV